MNQIQSNTEILSNENRSIGVLDLFIILAKRKKVVFGFPLVSAILAAGISLLIPNSYQANTKLLPPQQSQSGAAALLSQLGGVAGAVASTAGLKNSNDLYVGMLKSRTVADRLIEKFNLKKAYDLESVEKTRLKLEANTAIASGKDGFITIAVEDENQKLVAPLANAYADELLKLTGTLAITEASKRRVFYERQLGQAKDNLANAELVLKKALETHGVISVDTESRVIVETMGRLRAQISAKEIQLNSMSAFVTAQNPEYKRVQEDLVSLREELAKLENGRSPASEQSADGKQPGLENIKILRDVKYYQMLYEILSKQYEVARLDEAKDPSIVQVLDPATEPERKFKPKRLFIVLGALVASFLAAAFWAFLREGAFVLQRKDAEKWNQVKAYLRFNRS
ncbi:Wzz/FepE/Etk N-terminal domain-containing protein [Massilia kyonggiensis]|nr:Wzz/FepE/Etk N-terminal domain-containing protein [Massilia kyonggiensis]